MWSRERQPVTFAMPPWEEAILRPGAQQLIHLKNLMLSRPYFSRIPGQDMLVDLAPAPPVAGPDDRLNPRRAAYPVATRDAGGAYGLVYFPQAEQTFKVDLRLLNGPVKAWWYDPRSGRSHFAGDYPSYITSFTSPIAGPDWVLVLDATA
jgi:hypothetical protein